LQWKCFLALEHYVAPLEVTLSLSAVVCKC